MIDHSIHIKIDSFDGPLGLLLLLIQKEEMGICDLDINKITNQYVKYIEQMQELNFNVAGDYLYMAAILLFLKSRFFVSKDDVKRLIGEDIESDLNVTSEAELIKRLQELKRFQQLGEKLWTLPKLGHETYVRPKANRKGIASEVMPSMDIQGMVNVWVNLLRREKKKYKVMKKDPISIKERLLFLRSLLKLGEKTNFSDILERDSTNMGSQKGRTIVTFISLLELARLNKIEMFQNERYGNIFIKVLESLAHFNVDLADGFGSEENQMAGATEQH